MNSLIIVSGDAKYSKIKFIIPNELQSREHYINFNHLKTLGYRFLFGFDEIKNLDLIDGIEFDFGDKMQVVVEKEYPWVKLDLTSNVPIVYVNKNNWCKSLWLITKQFIKNCFLYYF